MFGSKTEHCIREDDTPSLFPEDEEAAPIENAPQKVSEHERRVRQPNALSEIPSNLPREERIIDVPEEKRQGMTLIGYEESERIAYRTGLYVIHFKQSLHYVYALLSKQITRKSSCNANSRDVIPESLSKVFVLRDRKDSNLKFKNNPLF